MSVRYELATLLNVGLHATGELAENDVAVVVVGECLFESLPDSLLDVRGVLGLFDVDQQLSCRLCRYR